MGKNVTDNSSGTIFLDIDGTLVYHNYDVDEVPDSFIPSSLGWLKEKYREGYKIILTTSRTSLMALKVRIMLESEGIESIAICELGTGERILVNDSKDGVKKAVAINVPRNVGVENE
jgi:predicted mannosyl-3-phosphoglycerate phosphatase (HAD superfamily)